VAGFGSFLYQYWDAINDRVSAAAPGAGQLFNAEMQLAVAGRASQSAQCGSVECGLAVG
jgi:hypothetical protein